MKAMVLTAGLGTRLRPLTDFTPKPLLPLFGRTILDYTLESLSEAGVAEVVLNLHHLPDEIISHVGSESFGMPVRFSSEPEILGPTGGLRKALPLLGDEPFLVVNGDVVMDIDFNALFSRHVETGAALTLAVGKVEKRPELNSIGVSPDSRVRQIWKKPAWNGPALSEYVNLGAFVYNPEIIKKYVPDGVFFDFKTGIIPLMFDNDDPIAAFPVDTYWNDIGTVATYLQAHLDVFAGGGTEKARRSCAAGLAEPSPVFSRPVYAEDGLTIGDNASIGPNVALYSGCGISAGARVGDSVVMPGTAILEGAHVRRSVVFNHDIIAC